MKHFIIGFLLGCIINWVFIFTLGNLVTIPEGHPQVKRLWANDRKIVNFESFPNHDFHVFNYSMYPCLIGVGLATKSIDLNKN